MEYIRKLWGKTAMLDCRWCSNMRSLPSYTLPLDGGVISPCELVCALLIPLIYFSTHCLRPQIRSASLIGNPITYSHANHQCSFLQQSIVHGCLKLPCLAGKVSPRICPGPNGSQFENHRHC